MSAVVVRPLGIADVAEVAQLVKRSFDPELLPYMIYGQAGIDSFLAAGVTLGGATPHVRRLVVTHAQTPASIDAYGDFRLNGSAAFLSYICVSEAMRGRRLATRLIAEFVAANPHADTLALDVFHDNNPAINLYRSLGFQDSSSTCWVRRPVPEGSSVENDGGPAVVANLPMVQPAYDRYGFCEVEVEIAEGTPTERVGLLGPGVVRCHSSAAFENDGLLIGLKRTFPQLEVAFAVVSEELTSEGSKPSEIFCRSNRMTLKLDQFRAHRRGLV
ncbi:MAG: GNAT family N-acetyltransferase [Kineosporiaceae bacterium]|nr:GNAT family N-acetyltransferase [Aeromicrobium sp.]